MKKPGCHETMHDIRYSLWHIQQFEILIWTNSNIAVLNIMSSPFRDIFYRTIPFVSRIKDRAYRIPPLARVISVRNNNSCQYKRGCLKNTPIEIGGKNNSIVIGDGSVLHNSRIVVYGSDHNLVIGNDCIIKNCVFWFEDDHCTITVGDHTSIEGAEIAVTEPGSLISLGEDCMLSFDIDIRCGDSHSIIDTITNSRINFAQDIIIGDHVWLGAHAQVLKGANVGENCVVGTRAVVTSNIPSNSIVAGIPAKIIRTNTNWKRERIYQVD